MRNVSKVLFEVFVLKFQLWNEFSGATKREMVTYIRFKESSCKFQSV